jgi:hypothetical protein
MKISIKYYGEVSTSLIEMKIVSISYTLAKDPLEKRFTKTKNF